MSHYENAIEIAIFCHIGNFFEILTIKWQINSEVISLDL